MVKNKKKIKDMGKKKEDWKKILKIGLQSKNIFF